MLILFTPGLPQLIFVNHNTENMQGQQGCMSTVEFVWRGWSAVTRTSFGRDIKHYIYRFASKYTLLSLQWVVWGNTEQIWQWPFNLHSKRRVRDPVTSGKRIGNEGSLNIRDYLRVRRTALVIRRIRHFWKHVTFCILLPNLLQPYIQKFRKFNYMNSVKCFQN